MMPLPMKQSLSASADSDPISTNSRHNRACCELVEKSLFDKLVTFFKLSKKFEKLFD